MDQEHLRLKLKLVASDAAVLLAVWFPVLAFGPMSDRHAWLPRLAIAVFIIALALSLMSNVGLLLSRRCAVRAMEMRLIVKVTILTTSIMLLIDRVSPLARLGLPGGSERFYVSEAVLGGILMVVGLTIERGTWRAILRASRQAGYRERPVLIIGTNSDARRLATLLGDHTELGMRVVGVAGSREDAQRNELETMWLGTLDEVEHLVDTHALTGVVVAAAPMDQPALADLMRRLHERDLHIHLSPGVAGIDMNRIRSLPMAREPVLYVESHKLGLSDMIAKRTLDLAGSIFGIVVLSPLMLAIAIAIKATDHGPVFYRQTRGGRNGTLFNVIKFRTMAPGSDAAVDKLAALNERGGGPLFKLEHDPRVTKIGKLLRLTSLDELPQLFNVLLGQMSLVGPRPALPKEIAEFDDRLRTRELVRPGITGLWQVEARDSPSFDAYRRLDLFYVENWSLMGDIAILVDTVEHLVGRVYRSLIKRPAAQTAHVLPPDLPGAGEMRKSA
jgi:exopolysaccharide biosynthesis polyprenyl glycosylphosphotransferase